MLKKTEPTLLSQHGRIVPPASTWLSSQAPKRLEQRSSLPYGWRPYGIMTAADEVLFAAYPERYINDPRFVGRMRTRHPEREVCTNKRNVGGVNK